MRFKAFDMRRYWAVTGLVVLSAGCSDFIRQDRAPVTLVIDRLEGAPGQSTTFGGTLQSDVLTNGGVISDGGRATLRLVMKDVGTAPSAVNAVTLNRYRITFRRPDGRNTPGVDVPFPFDSAVTVTITPGVTGVTAGFELIRHSSKLEAPLAALAQGLVLISTVADVTFFGRDQAGNDISTTGSIGVIFGDFADP